MAMIGTMSVREMEAPRKQSTADSLLSRLSIIDNRLAAHGNTLSDTESAIIGGASISGESQNNPVANGFLSKLENIVSSIESRFDPIETSINRVRTAF